MTRFRQILIRLIRDDRGQDIIEYALMTGFFVSVCVAGLPNLVPSLSTMMSKVVSVLVLSANS